MTTGKNGVHVFDECDLIRPKIIRPNWIAKFGPIIPKKYFQQLYSAKIGFGETNLAKIRFGQNWIRPKMIRPKLDSAKLIRPKLDSAKFVRLNLAELSRKNISKN